MLRRQLVLSFNQLGLAGQVALFGFVWGADLIKAIQLMQPGDHAQPLEHLAGFEPGAAVGCRGLCHSHQ